MTKLDSHNLYDVANGSTLLASVCGGSIKTAYSFIRQVNQQETGINLRLPTELEAKNGGALSLQLGRQKNLKKLVCRALKLLLYRC